MNEQPTPQPPSEISDADWERTPSSVKRYIEELQRRLAQQEQQQAAIAAEIELLKETIGITSRNSSKAPSTDPPSAPKRQRKKSSGKKRGGQPGHEGHSRRLYPVDECDRVFDHYPESCPCCGEQLQGEDANPYRHQIVDIPPLKPIVAEHRLHQRECPKCGTISRAQLPPEESNSGYGATLVAVVALLSSLYRHSERMVVSAMQDLFGIEMSIGTVNRLRQEASAAVAVPVNQAQEYIQQQPVVGADETSTIRRKSRQGYAARSLPLKVHWKGRANFWLK